MVTKHKSLKISIIVGESSGDTLGASLIKGLQDSNVQVKLHGLAGPLMQKEGMQSLFPVEELSVMGIAEILPKIPQLLKRIKQTVVAIETFAPDIVITIDAPDFSKRVVKRLRKDGVLKNTKFIHYVAPTVWAWRPGRAKLFSKIYDAMLCLFPFEPPYFKKEGMQAYFVGHPAIKEDLKGSPRLKTLGVFYGSRIGELQRTGTVLTATAKDWLVKNPDGRLIIPTLPHMESHIRPLIKDVSDRCEIIIGDKKAAFSKINKAIAVSGTIGLELAIAGIPHLIAYKANSFTFWLVKKLVRVKYAHLANIILNEAVVPEYLQIDCTEAALIAGLDTLNEEKQRAAFEKLHADLQSDKSAADILLTL